ncbi:MAG: hypothetical protein ABH867_01100 [Patescibacteria group bacterium]|nr:hypothetical protein [Patescibacteria group bacterium]
MKKFLPFIVITILVIAIIGAAFIFSSKNSTVQPESLSEEIEEETASRQEEQEESIVGSLKEALSVGRSMECTWKKDENNYGLSRLKNDRVYTEVVAEGKKTHSIFADNCNYTWTEDESQGVKICIEPEKTEEGEVSQPEEFSWETPDISYSCKEVVISDTIFDPPAGIEFINPFEMMPGVNLPEGVGLPTGN